LVSMPRLLISFMTGTFPGRFGLPLEAVAEGGPAE
jgi:hypothetical protein